VNDFNRDGHVDALGQLIARMSVNASQSALSSTPPLQFAPIPSPVSRRACLPAGAGWCKGMLPIVGVGGPRLHSR